MRAADLGLRFIVASKASGKTRAQIAAEAGTTESTLSRIAQGHAVNMRRDLLARIAETIGTTVGYLHGDPMELSPEDREVLLQFRDWIDDKLPKIDAREEPNAILIASEAKEPARAQDMIADRDVTSIDVPRAFARRDVQHVMRASGESMINAGIVNNDTLYATNPPKDQPLGKVVACRLGGSIYVKRMAKEHDRLLLLSANPQYLPIEVDKETDEFEIIGVVIGRTGAVE